MKNNDFEIAMSVKTPEIKWSKGVLTIKGRSIPEDCQKFYNPIIDLAKEIDNKSLTLNFYLEYINTSSSLSIFNLLKAIEANEKIKSISVNWYYEDDDPDMLEQGEMFSEKLSRIKFEYLECVGF